MGSGASTETSPTQPAANGRNLRNMSREELLWYTRNIVANILGRRNLQPASPITFPSTEPDDAAGLLTIACIADCMQINSRLSCKHM